MCVIFHRHFIYINAFFIHNRTLCFDISETRFLAEKCNRHKISTVNNNQIAFHAVFNLQTREKKKTPCICYINIIVHAKVAEYHFSRSNFSIFGPKACNSNSRLKSLKKHRSEWFQSKQIWLRKSTEWIVGPS